MKAFGLTLDDVAVEPIDIWPDNLQAFTVFNAVSSQWRTGMQGATGLDYGVLPDTFRMMSIPRKEWPDLFADIRVMESDALSAMRTEP